MEFGGRTTARRQDSTPRGCATKVRWLAHVNVEKRCPILDGLKREANQDQTYAKDPHAFFGYVIGFPFDEWRTWADRSL